MDESRRLFPGVDKALREIKIQQGAIKWHDVPASTLQTAGIAMTPFEQAEPGFLDPHLSFRAGPSGFEERPENCIDHRDSRLHSLQVASGFKPCIYGLAPCAQSFNVLPNSVAVETDT